LKDPELDNKLIKFISENKISLFADKTESEVIELLKTKAEQLSNYSGFRATKYWVLAFT